MVFFTFSLAWSYISGINVVEKYLREGMLYLGSIWFIRAVKPVSSTMEKGWKSRAIISPMIRVILRASGWPLSYGLDC